MNLLEQLKTYTKVVADTGDFASIEVYTPVDGLTILMLTVDHLFASEVKNDKWSIHPCFRITGRRLHDKSRRLAGEVCKKIV